MMWYLATSEGRYLLCVIGADSLFTFTEHAKFESREKAQALLDSEADLPPGLEVTEVAPGVDDG